MCTHCPPSAGRALNVKTCKRGMGQRVGSHLTINKLIVITTLVGGALSQSDGDILGKAFVLNVPWGANVTNIYRSNLLPI